jgi:hypothetical protein
MDFLNHRKWGMVYNQVFLLSTVETVRSCVTLKTIKSQGKAVEMNVNSREENSLDFCLDFV